MRTLVNLSVVLSLALVPALVGCSERNKDGTVSPIDKNNVFDKDSGTDFNPGFNPGNGNNDSGVFVPPSNEDAGVTPTGPACDEASEGVAIFGETGQCDTSTRQCLWECESSSDQVAYNNCRDVCFAADSDLEEVTCEQCLAFQQYKCIADYGCEPQVDALLCCAAATPGAACSAETSALNNCVSSHAVISEKCVSYNGVAYSLCFP